MTIQSIPLSKAFRLLNHGPVLLVSGCHNGTDNAMAAAWGCPLDYNPCRLTVVLDKSAFTRNLIEQSGRFAVRRGSWRGRCRMRRCFQTACWV